VDGEHPLLPNPRYCVCEHWQRDYYCDGDQKKANLYVLIKDGRTAEALELLGKDFRGIPEELIGASRNEVRKVKGRWSFKEWIPEVEQ